MRCLYPRTVSFKSDGTIAWSRKSADPEFVPFKLPCNKCIECRLEYARQWAVRCVHEARVHDDNVFITLTYSDEKLSSPKLDYSHFQNFMKRLRELRFQELLDSLFPDSDRDSQRVLWRGLPKDRRKELYGTIEIGFFVTGEYGDRFKRPHWHAILFNWSPRDLVFKYTSDRGDRVFSSVTLDELWSNGITEVGSVTFESAGYCARYAAKKLVHGQDGTHDYVPISKKSSRHAIGKRFLERFWKDIFSYGEVVLSGGAKCSIPRYYEKWLLKHRPDDWYIYIMNVKVPKMAGFEKKALADLKLYEDINNSRALGRGALISKAEVRSKLITERFKVLQSYLKGM